MSNYYYFEDESNFQQNDQNQPDYNIPPDFNMCLKHFQACTFRKELNDQSVCQCCARSVDKVEMKFCESVKYFSFGGPGYTLFYNYIFLCGIIYSLGLLIFGIYAFISNHNGNFCKSMDEINKMSEYKGKTTAEIEKLLENNNKICVGGFFNNISLINRKNVGSDPIQIILITVFLVLVMLLLQGYRYYSRKWKTKIDDQIITNDDFSIFVQDIKFQYGFNNYEQQLMDHFTNQSLPDRVTPVADVVLCYDLQQFQDLNKSKKAIIKRKQEYISQRNEILQDKHHRNKAIKDLVERNIMGTNNELAQNNEQIKDLQKSYMKGSTDKDFIGKAMVIYQYSHDRDDVLNKQNLDSMNQEFMNSQVRHASNIYLFNGGKLFIKKCEAPTDILWQNLCYSRSNKAWRFCLSIFFLVIFQFGALISVFLLMNLKNEKAQQLTGLQKTIIPLLIGISIAIINAIFSAIISLLVNQQKHYNLIKERSFLSIQTAIFKFFTTGLVVFCVALYEDTLFTYSKGFIATESTVFITNALVPQLMIFLDIGYIIQRIQRCLESKKGIYSIKTQKQANKLFTDSEFDLASAQADVGYNMILFCTYLPIMPFVSVMMLISVILQFYLYKQQLMYRRSFLNYISAELNQQFTSFIEVALLLLTLNKIFMDYWIFGYCHPLNWVNLALTIVYFSLPNETINKKLFKVPCDETNLVYDEQKNQMNIVLIPSNENKFARFFSCFLLNKLVIKNNKLMFLQFGLVQFIKNNQKILQIYFHLMVLINRPMIHVIPPPSIMLRIKKLRISIQLISRIKISQEK